MENTVIEKENSNGLYFVYFVLIFIYLFHIYSNNILYSKPISNSEKETFLYYDQKVSDLIKSESFSISFSENTINSSFFIPQNKFFLIKIKEKIDEIKKDNVITLGEYRELSTLSRDLYKKDISLKEKII